MGPALPLPVCDRGSTRSGQNSLQCKLGNHGVGKFRLLLESEAGLIAVDANGDIALPFNTRVMNRAWWTGGEIETGVYR